MKMYYSSDGRAGLNSITPKRQSESSDKINKIDGKAYISHSWRQKRQLMESGYIVQPQDCPPIRNLTKYGYQVFAAGKSIIERHDNPQSRCTSENSSTNGFYTHSGEKCKISDSLFLSSWLANSEYVKVITGIVFFCPVGYGLYQGPIPYKENDDYEVLSAIEYSNSMGTYEISGEKYFMVEANVVIKPLARRVEIERGMPLALIYPVMRPADFDIEALDFDFQR